MIQNKKDMGYVTFGNGKKSREICLEVSGRKTRW
jgi:hypothetical protein